MYYKFIALLSLIFLLLFTGPVSATTLTGKVVDSENNPIPNVTLTASQDGLGSIADLNGQFEIKLPDHIAWITFSAIGFQPRQFKLSAVPDPVILETKYYPGTDIIVSATRSNPSLHPIAVDNISGKEIERDYAYGEFPLLLKSTPNLHAYSDAGSAFGYSYIRIRGFDDKRITTYINGVPLNDPEDQATYFVDLPDFASTASDIQIQRGVGNSLYGEGSFGGSINIVTNPFLAERKTTLTAGYGAYTADNKKIGGIYRQGIQFNSGLIAGQWQYAGRYSKQASDGYRDNSWYRGWSYYFSVARLDPNMSTQLEIYGGPMKMHLSYYGIPKDILESNPRYNPLSYSNETDNFNQPHYQLTNRYRINENATLTNTLFYIRGKGYYEQFKDSADFHEYDLFTVAGTVEGEIVRQQLVHKNQVGWSPRLEIKHERGSHTLGGSFYIFESDHWGQVVWINPYDSTYQLQSVSPQHKYYQYYGKKYSGSVYFSESYQLNEKLNGQLALQVRYQSYKFDQVAMGAFVGYDYDLDWLFLSPRFGLGYQLTDKIRLFGNFSIASRTPTDVSIYEANDPYAVPNLDLKSERVNDYELGVEFTGAEYLLSANLYYMDFKDEIVPSGGITDVGVIRTSNAPRSYHSGIELSGDYRPSAEFQISGNFSFTHDRIKSWSMPTAGVVENYSGKTIPFSPEYIGNLTSSWNYSNLLFTARAHFVGSQFGEMNNSDEFVLDAYQTVGIDINYSINNFFGFGKLTLLGRVDNLLNKKFVTSGYGWTDWGGGAEYYPGAERSFYGQLKLDIF